MLVVIFGWPVFFLKNRKNVLYMEMPMHILDAA